MDERDCPHREPALKKIGTRTERWGEIIDLVVYRCRDCDAEIEVREEDAPK